MRKRRAEKRYIKPDPKYNDLLVAKFINYLMLDGKKTTARKVVYESFDVLEQKTKKPALEVFKLLLKLEAEGWVVQLIKFLWKLGLKEELL